jgi:Restriction alleviation protein Lar
MKQNIASEWREVPVKSQYETEAYYGKERSSVIKGSTLEHCGHCGGRAEWVQSRGPDNISANFRIECVDCGIGTKIVFSCKQELRKILYFWNRRIDPKGLA